MSVLDLADRLWRGEEAIEDHHPVLGPTGEVAEMSEGLAFVHSLANVSAFDTGEGLVLIDTGSAFFAQAIHDGIRAWSARPLHTAVYSHGHIDHVFGVPAFAEEAAAQGWPAPRVIAHEALPARFDRYILTAGYNEAINRRQMGAARLRWPTEYRYPDETYRDTMTLTVADDVFELHHARGETDDHTWTWVPTRRVLCSGDLFIWATPNAGNPQKVQRYAREWSVALRAMASLGPEVLLPGHGVPVIGADRVRQALTDTADLLESLHDQTVDLMNQGACLNDIIHAVTPPAHLMDRPYLRPVYDEPEFIVRNVWRLYGGWFDGEPDHLKPAPRVELSRELAALAGGAARLADRAAELAAAGDLRLACHLAEMSGLADPDSQDIRATRTAIYQARAEAETSTMSKGIFGWAARSSDR